MSSNDWMNNPLLKDIDPVKLQILKNLADEGSKKTQKDMMPFLMSAMSQANQKGVSFTGPERELLFSILMQNMSPEERKKAETIIKMTSTFRK